MRANTNRYFLWRLACGQTKIPTFLSCTTEKRLANGIEGILIPLAEAQFCRRLRMVNGEWWRVEGSLPFIGTKCCIELHELRAALVFGKS